MVVAVASTQVVHLLNTVLALDAEGNLAVEGELVLFVDAPAAGAGTLGDGSGVRGGQANGLVALLNGVQVLPAGRSLTLGSVAQLGVLGAAVDLQRSVY